MTSLITLSHFSFLRAASSPDELAEEAAKLGHHALALTDVQSVGGAVRHQRACERYGLRPIIGVTVYVDNSPIVVIARRQQGYHRICVMLSTGMSPLDVVQENDEDLAVLTGGWMSMAARLARERNNRALREWLERLPRHSTWISLVHHERPGDSAAAQRLINVGQSLNMPIVIGTEAFHASRDAYRITDIMTCIRHGITVFEPHAERPVNDSRHLLCEADILRRFGNIITTDILRETDAFAEACTTDLLPGHVTPPTARLAEGADPRSVLRQHCESALPMKYGENPEARQQLEHELEIIGDLELAEFFLVVQEVIHEAQRRGIRYSGRGSAANSIVSYLLGITHVCPLRFHLLFERFLHRGRKGTPDIDVDFDSERREEIIAWMEERFGIDHTAMTATVITYRPRMAVRDVAKALGWPNDVIDSLTKSIPGYTNKDIREYRNDMAAVVGDAPLLDTLITMATELLGRPRHFGLHVGGMVLSREPIHERSPVQRSANGVAMVQFDKDDVEAMGLVKFDVLGLRMLACLGETVELIMRHEGTYVDLDVIPPDDPSTFDLIRSGKTLGIFQIESQGQMHLLAQHQPETFDDLITEVALFRPGPLQGGMVHPYIRRRRGLEPVVHLHPFLEPILADTLGIVLFQEQVLEIAHRFAGMPLDRADDFRALVSKNRDRAAMAAMKDEFVKGALERGVDLAAAELVYEKVSHFVGYGFCRSHAAAFARIVVQSAWMKTHHPAAFFAAFMQHRPGMYNLVTLEEEARRCGVRVHPPDLRYSGIRYDLFQEADGTLSILKPLTSITGCSADLAKRIVWERSKRPFTSIADVVERLYDIVAVDVLDMLARSGACDALSDSSRTALWEMGVALRRMKERRARHTQTLTLFDMPLVQSVDIAELPALTAPERLAWDYVSHGAARLHPMTLYRRLLTDLEIRPISTAQAFERKPHHHNNDTGIDLTLAGIVILRQSPPTAHGVLFVTLEDETGFIQCVVRPDIREHFVTELRNSALIVRGRIHAIGPWRGLLVQDVRDLRGVYGGEAGGEADGVNGGVNGGEA
ncbi:MAG TPA: hypothetical protein DIS79_03925, partial [Bacteroidetes bacterium]|nr:hypothetical protein [Bacteroidota bacterium]